MEAEAKKRQKLMSVEEYLAFEECSSIRHEYVAGGVYAFAGATVRHNRIAGNIYRTFADAGDLNACEVLFGDVKLRVSANVFYYPDIMVSCDSKDDDPLIKSRPCAVVEVLSTGTRVTDLREKLMFYRQVDSIDVYLMVEQDERKVYRHWRDDERLWWSESVSDGRTIPIPCLGIDLSLDDIYRNLPLADAS